VNVVGDEPVRILSLFPSLDPAGGGIQSGGMSMVLASARAGVEHVVSCTERSSARSRSQVLVGSLEQAGIPVVTFPPLQRPVELADRWSVSLAQVPWISRHVGGFDAVHLHGVWNIGALSGLAFARLRDVPIVVTAHESLTANDIDKSRTTARRTQKLALKSLYLRWTNLFILTSQLETAESLPAHAPQETIPYPLFDGHRPAPALRPRGATRELRIGYLGRIAPKKNVPTLVEALGSLPEHVRLIVAGDGPAEIVQRARRRAEELGVVDRIEWLGFVPPEDRAQFLQTIDLLAMPSSYESFGMAAAEAMLAGVPLVVSQRTGIAELLARHGGGVVVRPTAESVAAAILDLDADRERLADLGVQAQRAVCDELDYDRVGQRLRDAYHRVVGAAASKAA
jgi:glycosyltransferase involved in cell wall biosynthesis